MNKTININLGGLPFIMDEEAYERLKEYIASLKRHFAATDGHEEIMHDIEVRIAEILGMKINAAKKIITTADIDEVVAIIGKPQDLGDETGATGATNQDEGQARYNNTRRRLFRDDDNKVIGGVCAGLGAFFDIDPVWIRLIWAVSFFVFGFGFLLYIILLIIIPKAKTPAEKLEMRGDKYDLDSIKRSFKEEGERFERRMKDIANEYGGPAAKERYRRKGEDFMHSVTPAVSEIGNIFLKVILSFVLFVVATIFVVLIAALLSNDTIIHIGDDTPFEASFWNLAAMFTDTAAETNLVVTGLALLILTPLSMLIYGTIKALFGVRKKNKVVGYIGSILFWAGLIICIYEGIRIFQRYDEKERVVEIIDLPTPKGDTLFVEARLPADGINMTEIGFGNGEYLAQFDPIYFLPEARLNIVPSENGKCQLKIERIARGKNSIEATENASAIKVNHQIADSTTLVIDRFSMLPQGTKFRGQRATLVLSVPVGKYIALGNSTRKMLMRCQNVQDMNPHKMAGHVWKVEPQGLNCQNCGNLTNQHNDEGENNF